MSFIAGDEDSAKFHWIFGQFKYFFEKVPEVFMTDSCQKMNAAILEQFPVPATVHLLCVWHISKNFFTNIKGLMKKSEFSTAIRMFWKLAKKTDSKSHDSFDAEFSSLVEFIENSAMSTNMHLRDPKVFKNAIEWLKIDLYSKRFQWAYRFTFCHFTAGCQSTQRSESIHRVIKVIKVCITFIVIIRINKYL